MLKNKSISAPTSGLSFLLLPTATDGGKWTYGKVLLPKSRNRALNSGASYPFTTVYVRVGPPGRQLEHNREGLTQMTRQSKPHGPTDALVSWFSQNLLMHRLFDQIIRVFFQLSASDVRGVQESTRLQIQYVAANGSVRTGCMSAPSSSRQLS